MVTDGNKLLGRGLELCPFYRSVGTGASLNIPKGDVIDSMRCLQSDRELCTKELVVFMPVNLGLEINDGFILMNDNLLCKGGNFSDLPLSNIVLHWNGNRLQMVHAILLNIPGIPTEGHIFTEHQRIPATFGYKFSSRKADRRNSSVVR
ncbi:hypothetical protein SDC9_105278 [bioreactor metagenome]|uniref:Uncharacterized protein n=1 Tax=bioreactor metagenome TaxID=1076179 RepID=A0A645AZ51_9ZZZZ